VNVGEVEAVPRDRRDAHEAREVGDRRREARRHRLTQLVGAGSGGGKGRRVGLSHAGNLKAPDQRGCPVPKNSPSDDVAPETPETDAASVGKGRATPTRKEQEAARKRPLVPDDRKAAAKASKAELAARRERARLGMERGEERYLPARD